MLLRGRARRVGAALAAVLAVAMIATACGGGGGQDEQTVTLDWAEPENPLVPGDTTEQNGGDVIDALFAGLVRYDVETADPQLETAQAIDTTDNRTFTIRLKPGWTFHDGTPVTAQNYVGAWNWTAYGPNAAQAQSFMEKIEGYDQVASEQPTAPTMSGLRVVDPLTFTVTLKQPFTIFPTTLGYSAYYPLPNSFFADQQAWEQRPVGNGEYRFDSRTPNQNLVLVRNDQYAGENKPSVPRLEYRVYSELQTAYDDRISGNLDHVKSIPSSALSGGQWRQDLGQRAHLKEGLNITVLGFPLYDPRFADPRVRQAFSMALNRQEIVDQLFNGVYRPMDGLATAAAEGYVPNQCGPACTFDPQRARQLLAEAGGFAGPLTLTANSDGGHDVWMQAVTNQLRQNLGIDARYTPVPAFSELRRLLNAKQATGLFRSGWIGDYPNLETFLTQLYRTGGSSNDYGYSNPAVDAQLAAADAAPTREAADAGYQQAERLILADLPSIPLFTRPILYGDSERLSSGERNPLDRLVSTSFQLAPQG